MDLKKRKKIHRDWLDARGQAEGSRELQEVSGGGGLRWDGRGGPTRGSLRRARPPRRHCAAAPGAERRAATRQGGAGRSRAEQGGAGRSRAEQGGGERCSEGAELRARRRARAGGAPGTGATRRPGAAARAAPGGSSVVALAGWLAFSAGLARAGLARAELAPRARALPRRQSSPRACAAWRCEGRRTRWCGVGGTRACARSWAR
jgi:hypothetical protein